METDTSITVSSDDFSSEVTDTLEYNENVSDQLNDVIINQYAQKVIDFSSQYGSDTSISYTAYNITGRPSKYPDYGDFPETFAMRTYGRWWEIAPSAVTEIMPQNFPDIPIHDFIIVEFEEYVIPHEIFIFETYNPGAIVKIWAYIKITEKWQLLWEGLPERTERKARKFSPFLKKLTLPTKIIRLEFNHSCLDYFTAIDGIVLKGIKSTIKVPEFICAYKKRNKKGTILKKLESVQFKLRQIDNHNDILKEFLANDLCNFMKDAGLVPDNNIHFTLKDLPCEILFKIFSYLDLVSLFRVSETCKSLYDVVTAPSLYTEINLKPYWNLASSELIATLMKRAILLKKLDMSWCGCFHSITATDFKEFIKSCGKNLTHLRLNSCKFLNASCLEVVGNVCLNLKELTLRNYTKPPSVLNFHCLKNLHKLERLDLFRTIIDTDLLVMTIRNNSKLKHLNLGICNSSVNMDDIALHISDYNKELVSLDLWKSHYLSSIGLKALAKCKHLEEVDFGWCLREEASPGESIKALVEGCPKLRKIFLAAIRGLTDRDLDNIADSCPNLEQLDLMGVMGISSEMCFKILTKCKNLILLDLSFCDQIDELQIALWRDIFGVSIKRSYVPSDFLF